MSEKKIRKPGRKKRLLRCFAAEFVNAVLMAVRAQKTADPKRRSALKVECTCRIARDGGLKLRLDTFSVDDAPLPEAKGPDPFVAT